MAAGTRSGEYSTGTAYSIKKSTSGSPRETSRQPTFAADSNIPTAAANSISTSTINGSSKTHPDTATWKNSMNAARATHPTATSIRRAKTG